MVRGKTEREGRGHSAVLNKNNGFLDLHGPTFEATEAMQCVVLKCFGNVRVSACVTMHNTEMLICHIQFSSLMFNGPL